MTWQLVRRRVLDDVGDRLLDDPVGGQVQPGGKPGPLAADVEVHPDAGLRRSASARRSRSARPGAGTSAASHGPGPAPFLAPVSSSRSTPSSARISRSALRLVSSIDDSARAASSGCACRHVVGHPRLHRDHAQGVRHHVVQLAGDLQPFLAPGPAGLGQLLARPAARPAPAGRAVARCCRTE